MKLYLHIDVARMGKYMESVAKSDLSEERKISLIKKISSDVREKFDRLAQIWSNEVILWGGDEIIIFVEEKDIAARTGLASAMFLPMGIVLHLRTKENFSDLYKESKVKCSNHF